MKAIIDIISRAYKWFWNWLLCRKEPFTYQLTRMMIKHGAFFWAVILLIVLKLSSYILTEVWWQKILAGFGMVFIAWLIDHLVDQVRLNPERYE